MRFKLNWVVFGRAVGLASQRAHKLQPRSFATPNSVTSTIDTGIAGFETRLSPEAVSLTSLSQLQQPESHAKPSGTAKWSLYQLLLAEYAANARIPHSHSLQQQPETQHFSGLHQELSQLSSKKPRLSAATLAEGSSTGKVLPDKQRDTGARISTRPSTSDYHAAAFELVPEHQNERAMAHHLEKFSKETSSWKDRPIVKEGLAEPVQRPGASLNSREAGYIYHDYGLSLKSSSDTVALTSPEQLQQPGSHLKPSGTEEQSFYQLMLAEHRTRSKAVDSFRLQHPEAEHLFSRNEALSPLSRKKPRLQASALAEGSPSIRTLPHERNDLEDQTSTRPSSTSGYCVADSKFVPEHHKKIAIQSHLDEISRTSPEKIGGGKDVTSLEESLPIATQNLEASLNTGVGGCFHHDHWLKLPESPKLPVPRAPGLPEVQIEASSYPSRFLTVDFGNIHPKIAHAAEFLSQEFLEQLIRSSAPYMQTSLQHAGSSSKSPPKHLLLPFTYKLLVKGITGSQWARIRYFFQDFRNKATQATSQNTEDDISLLVWFCEFVCEATIPELFPKSYHEGSQEEATDSNSGAKKRIIQFGYTRLIKFFSVPEFRQFRIEDASREGLVDHLFEKGKEECKKAENQAPMERSVLQMKIHDRLKSISKEIEEYGSEFQRGYQKMSRCYKSRWRRMLKALLLAHVPFEGSMFTKPFRNCFSNREEVVQKLLGEKVTEAGQISCWLKHKSFSSDQLLKKFTKYEYSELKRDETGFNLFLPGRIHHFFKERELWDKE